MFGSELDDRYSVSGRGRVFYPLHYAQNVVAFAWSHFPRMLVLASLSSRVKQWLYEVNHSYPPNAKVDNDWSYTSTAITSSLPA
jgi:hypothetical protein